MRKRKHWRYICGRNWFSKIGRKLPDIPVVPEEVGERYWVGGTGLWDDIDHWALTSGGEGGASLPTIETNVHIDENSGFVLGGTDSITMMDTDNGNGYAVCKTFTSTSGGSYTIIYNTGDLYVYGNVTLEAGVTFDAESQAYLNFAGGSVDSPEDISIIGNEANIPFLYCDSLNGTASLDLSTSVVGNVTLASLENSYAKFTLLSDLILEQEVSIDRCSFDANDFNVTSPGDITIGHMIGDGLLMGSGIWTTNAQFYISTSFPNPPNIHSETSHIIVDHTGSEGEVGIIRWDNSAEGRTVPIALNDVTLGGDDNNSFVLGGELTFDLLIIDTGTRTIKWTSGYTYTIKETFLGTGIDGSILTFTPQTGSARYNLKNDTGSPIVCDYLNIKDSNAIGDNSWYAGDNSVDSGNNAGWIFTGLPE